MPPSSYCTVVGHLRCASSAAFMVTRLVSAPRHGVDRVACGCRVCRLPHNNSKGAPAASMSLATRPCTWLTTTGARRMRMAPHHTPYVKCDTMHTPWHLRPTMSDV